jgi:hypothetical protein
MSSTLPNGHTLAAALGSNEALTGLLARVRASQDRLNALLPLLPPALSAGMRAGPLDDQAWVLLVGHAAAAAKLRQMLPMLEAALRERGWPGPPIRIKVLPRA